MTGPPKKNKNRRKDRELDPVITVSPKPDSESNFDSKPNLHVRDRNFRDFFEGHWTGVLIGAGIWFAVVIGFNLFYYLIFGYIPEHQLDHPDSLIP